MKNYLSFSCFSDASFIIRIASFLETGCAFFLISLHTCSRSLPSKGLNIFFLGFFTEKVLSCGGMMSMFDFRISKMNLLFGHRCRGIQWIWRIISK
jgi:hypothetical protein